MARPRSRHKGWSDCGKLTECVCVYVCGSLVCCHIAPLVGVCGILWKFRFSKNWTELTLNFKNRKLHYRGLVFKIKETEPPVFRWFLHFLLSVKIAFFRHSFEKLISWTITAVSTWSSLHNFWCHAQSKRWLLWTTVAVRTRNLSVWQYFKFHTVNIRR